MKNEIDSAVKFIANLLRGMGCDRVDAFSQSLCQVLVSHYRDHWFPEKPCRGSAYRCIRVNNKRIDPLLASAVVRAGLAESVLLEHFPSELTVWVDPNEVSYRFGEDGSIGIIYEERGQTPSAVESATSTSRVPDIYGTCRDQVQNLFQAAAIMSRRSDYSDRPVGLDYLRSFVMV